MKTVDPQMLLGDLVTAQPQLARTLEKLGLDYCCHGQRPIADAVDAADLDLSDVLQALDAKLEPDRPIEWQNMSMAELAAHTEHTHHAYLWEEMPRLSALIDKIVEVHGANHPELSEVQRVYALLRVTFEPHLRREELMVFPAITRLDKGGDPSVSAAVAGSDTTLKSRIDALIEEHDEAGELFEQLRAITGDYTTPADGCNTYRMTYEGLEELEADTHLHIHKENNVLFPEAVRREQALRATV